MIDEIMEEYLWYLCIYVIGIILDVYDNKKVTPKDMHVALIWPIRLSWFMLRGITAILHLGFANFLLVFYIKYKYSKLFETIDNKLWGN